jgi:hypothetical protein
MSDGASAAVEVRVSPAAMLRRLTKTCPSQAITAAIVRLERATPEQVPGILCETIAQLSGYIHRIRSLCVTYLDDVK